MKKGLCELNKHMFDQLERLNDDSLKGEELKQELERTKAMSEIAKQVINTGRLALDATKVVANGIIDVGGVPSLLSLEEETPLRIVNK